MRRPRRASRWRTPLWAVLFLLGGALCAWGFWQWTNPTPSDRVTQVRIAIRPGIANDAASVKSMLTPGNPDYYVKLLLHDGNDLRTSVYEDTPIGGGLTWDLQPALSLSAVQRVEVWDADTFGDDLQDQVAPEGERVREGQQFRIVLAGPPATTHPWALYAAVGGGLLALIGGGRLVWEQVV